VLATQNPIEYEGTFPLPEAQLDRFLIRISLGYPTKADEIDILERQQQSHPLESLTQVVESRDLIAAQQAIKNVYVDRLIKEYIVSLVEETRRHEEVYLGASPRGSLAFLKVARANAAIENRDYITPDDIKRYAIPVLGHRVILQPEYWMSRQVTDDVIRDTLDRTPVPVVK